MTSSLTSQFEQLTPQREQTADTWKTIPLLDSPHAISGFANVVGALKVHYLPAERWDSWLNKGSFTFRHKQHPRWQVRVFVDDGGRLADTYGLSLPGEAVVIGVDLTDRDPFERYAIRQFLRTYRFYMDPETGEKKIRLLTPQKHEDHFLEVVFVPPGPCESPVDEAMVAALIREIEQSRDLAE
jgi:hypothetical protein